MSYYPTTVAFAYNKPGETIFTCVSCGKEKWGSDPHTVEGVMMVEYDTGLEIFECVECGEVREL